MAEVHYLGEGVVLLLENQEDLYLVPKPREDGTKTKDTRTQDHVRRHEDEYTRKGKTFYAAKDNQKF